MTKERKEETMFEKFEGLVDAYRASAVRAITASEEYRMAAATAYSASQGKTEAQRKADADLATSKQRLNRDLAVLNADCAMWLVRYAIGRECVADDKAVGD